jgi:hypothetical protein
MVVDRTPHFHTVGRCVKHVTAWSYSLGKLPLTGSTGVGDRRWAGCGVRFVQKRLEPWVPAELSRPDLVPAIPLPTPATHARRPAFGVTYR